MFVFFDNCGLDIKSAEDVLLTAGEETWQAIRKLKMESLNPRDGMAKFYCDNLICNILIDLARSVTASKRGGKYTAGRNREIVQRLDMFIRTKLTEPLDREKLADFVHVSPPHLARIFAAETGLTPLEYLTRIRMERAKTLLVESSLSITQVAFDVGYDSISYFSQLFKKFTGKSPLKYRFGSR